MEAAAHDLQPQVLSDNDRDVGRLVAGLIDGEIERRAPVTFSRWASDKLGRQDLIYFVSGVWAMRGALVAFALAQLVEEGRASVIEGRHAADQLVWGSLDSADVPVRTFADGRLVLEAGVISDCAVALEVRNDPSFGTRIEFTGPAPYASQLKGAFSALRRLAMRSEGLFRGRCLRARIEEKHVQLQVIPPPADRRADLAIPASIWTDIDRNIHGLFSQRVLLESLGLGANRGVLLHGPPGTGKTQLARVVAAEVVPEATVLFLESAVIRSNLVEAYEIASQLAPALVVLDDLDLVVGDRRTGSSEALAEFLTAVDGAMTAHEGIVTLATTNNHQALDEAARRAARFDRIIEVPLPPAKGRELIWGRYLRDLGNRLDMRRLARATEGASGADIREIVRHAVLAVGGEPDMDTLLVLSRQRGFPQRPSGGQYL